MAITDKEEGVWELDQVYNKQNQGGIWDYDGITAWFTMGKNTDGQSGLNSGYVPAAYNTLSYSSPTQLPAGTSTWSKISSNSGRFFFGLKTDNTAWAWGLNTYGNLGINLSPPWPTVSANRSSPVQIGTDTNWSSNWTNEDSSALWIKTDGTLWSWGTNSSGNLGLNTGSPTNKISSPTQVGTDTTWSQIHTGGGSTTALKTDGSLWIWGSNFRGQLGLNQTHNTAFRSSPVRIGTSTDWSSIGASSNAKFALKTDGSLWTWGGDQYGRLGRNTVDVNISSPTQLGTDTTWDKFGSGYSHVLAVKTDNTLWSWGYNPFGNLGLNDQGPGGSTSRSSPTQVPGTNWSQVASGYLTSAATKTDGTLWTWGENEGGQMGHNTSGSPSAGAISSPTQVGTDTGWADPAATREEFFIKRIL